MDEGFVVNQEGVGLRLTAMQFWKCSEAGIALPFVHKNEPDCKFVIAESLPHQGETQIFSDIYICKAVGKKMFAPPPSFPGYRFILLVLLGHTF